MIGRECVCVRERGKQEQLHPSDQLTPYRWAVVIVFVFVCFAIAYYRLAYSGRWWCWYQRKSSSVGEEISRRFLQSSPRGICSTVNKQYSALWVQVGRFWYSPIEIDSHVFLAGLASCSRIGRRTSPRATEGREKNNNNHCSWYSTIACRSL